MYVKICFYLFFISCRSNDRPALGISWFNSSICSVVVFREYEIFFLPYQCQCRCGQCGCCLFRCGLCGLHESVLCEPELKVFSVLLKISKKLWKKIDTACKLHICCLGPKILQNLHYRFNHYYSGQIYSGDFTKLCGLLRIYEF